MALQNRSEAQERYTWNFTDIFASDDAWEQAYAEAEQGLEAIPALAGTLGASVESMKHALDTVTELERKVELVYLYAMLRKNVDNGDSIYQALSGRAMNLVVRLSTLSAFISPEILSIDAEKLKCMTTDPALKTYRHMLVTPTVCARTPWTKRPSSCSPWFPTQPPPRRIALRCFRAWT